MKRFLVVLLAVLAVLCLVVCTTKQAPPDPVDVEVAAFQAELRAIQAQQQAEEREVRALEADVAELEALSEKVEGFGREVEQTTDDLAGNHEALTRDLEGFLERENKKNNKQEGR